MRYTPYHFELYHFIREQMEGPAGETFWRLRTREQGHMRFYFAIYHYWSTAAGGLLEHILDVGILFFPLFFPHVIDGSSREA